MGRKKSRGKRKQRECTIYEEKIKSGHKSSKISLSKKQWKRVNRFPLRIQKDKEKENEC